MLKLLIVFGEKLLIKNKLKQKYVMHILPSLFYLVVTAVLC